MLTTTLQSLSVPLIDGHKTGKDTDAWQLGELNLAHAAELGYGPIQRIHVPSVSLETTDQANQLRQLVEALDLIKQSTIRYTRDAETAKKARLTQHIWLPKAKEAEWRVYGTVGQEVTVSMAMPEPQDKASLSENPTTSRPGETDKKTMFDDM
jgi:hypothetical protein